MYVAGAGGGSDLALTGTTASSPSFELGCCPLSGVLMATVMGADEGGSAPGPPVANHGPSWRGPNLRREGGEPGLQQICSSRRDTVEGTNQVFQ